MAQPGLALSLALLLAAVASADAATCVARGNSCLSAPLLLPTGNDQLSQGSCCAGLLCVQLRNGTQWLGAVCERFPVAPDYFDGFTLKDNLGAGQWGAWVQPPKSYRSQGPLYPATYNKTLVAAFECSTYVALKFEPEYGAVQGKTVVLPLPTTRFNEPNATLDFTQCVAYWRTAMNQTGDQYSLRSGLQRFIFVAASKIGCGRFRISVLVSNRAGSSKWKVVLGGTYPQDIGNPCPPLALPPPPPSPPPPRAKRYKLSLRPVFVDGCAVGKHNYLAAKNCSAGQYGVKFEQQDPTTVSSTFWIERFGANSSSLYGGATIRSFLRSESSDATKPALCSPFLAASSNLCSNLGLRFVPSNVSGRDWVIQPSDRGWPYVFIYNQARFNAGCAQRFLGTPRNGCSVGKWVAFYRKFDSSAFALWQVINS